jgi:hypothetical protein
MEHGDRESADAFKAHSGTRIELLQKRGSMAQEPRNLLQSPLSKAAAYIVAVLP